MSEHSTKTDRFGNTIDPLCDYARGRILRSAVEENLKMYWAWELLRKRIERYGRESIYCFAGINELFPVHEEDVQTSYKELAGPAFYYHRLRSLSLDHMGGNPERDDVAFFNRGSAAVVAGMVNAVERGTVVGFSPPPSSHSSVRIGAKMAGARFLEAASIEKLRELLHSEDVSLLVLTRTSAHANLMPLETLQSAIKLAKERGVMIFLDDAAGARMGPALYGQPKSLELGVELAVTSTEKSGLTAPRLGILAGRKEIVQKALSWGSMLGMEARPALAVSILRALERFEPGNLRKEKEYNDGIYRVASKLYGKRVQTTSMGGLNILAEDALEILGDRGEVANSKHVIVPTEAACSVAMVLQEETGIYTVASVGGAGCTFSIRLKPAYTEGLRFGDMERGVRALDDAFDRVARVVQDLDSVARILLGRYWGTGGS